MRLSKLQIKPLRSKLSGFLATSVLAACSPHAQITSDTVDPVNTSSLESEAEYATSKITPKRGAQVYVTSETLHLRRTADTSSSANIAGDVKMNDVLELESTIRVGEHEMISVRVVKSANAQLIGKTLYTSVHYLASTPQVRLSRSTGSNEASGQDTFAIVNLATEYIRLYKRCHAPEACQNKMIMEFHGTVGDNSKGMRSDVGTYKTTSWMKFYEVPGEYPAWYRPGYPPLPKPHSRGGWISKEVRPPGFSSTRGAFGWYTVFVGPNNSGQWMHGTIGWGEDKSSFVRFQDSFLGGVAGIFAKLGSHGCTRLSNEAIAFIRSNLPVGAYVMKVYAREAVRDAALAGYPKKGELGHFDYILTTRGYGERNSKHELADKDTVLRDGTPESAYLDQGTFDYDQTPTPQTGDHYHLGHMQGYFNVDEGTLTPDYRAPTGDKLSYGGYPGREQAIPSFARATAPVQVNAVVADTSRLNDFRPSQSPNDDGESDR